jgi:hypothetical protein
MYFKNYNIFLDDERFPSDVHLYLEGVDIYKTKEWVIVRNYKDFTELIQKSGMPNIISFDHDLGDFSENDEKTGYDCAKWLVDFCIDFKFNLPNFLVHTQNTTGAKDIQKYLENAKKHINILDINGRRIH